MRRVLGPSIPAPAEIGGVRLQPDPSFIIKGLVINEIFYSVQGESTYAGRPCVFVRLTACDLRCSWCDTEYAFYEGRKQSLDDVLAEVDRLDCPLVEVTGGEPLLQPERKRHIAAMLAGAEGCLVDADGLEKLLG